MSKDLSHYLIRHIKAIDWRVYSLVLILAVISVVLHILTDGIFLSPRNVSTLFVQASIVTVAALAQFFLLLTRQVDLSQGSAVTVLSVIAALVAQKYGWTTVPIVLLVMSVSTLIGSFYGLCVTKLRIPAFVVTLAGLLSLRGLALVISGGDTYGNLPSAFVILASGAIPKEATWPLIIILSVVLLAVLVWRYIARRPDTRESPSRPSTVPLALVGAAFAVGAGYVFSYSGIPIPVLIVLLLAVILAFLVARTVFGRHYQAVGDNPEAAHLAGISTHVHIIIGFMLSGCLVGVASIIWTARLAAAPPVGPELLILDTLTACIVGGASFQGGRGTILGAVVGALIVATLANGLSLLNVSWTWQYIVKAIVLFLAVTLNIIASRRGRYAFGA